MFCKTSVLLRLGRSTGGSVAAHPVEPERGRERRLDSEQSEDMQEKCGKDLPRGRRQMLLALVMGLVAVADNSY